MSQVNVIVIHVRAKQASKRKSAPGSLATAQTTEVFLP